MSCVAQGRWAYRSWQFSSGKRNLFASARAKKTARVSESLARSGSRRSDQDQGRVLHLAAAPVFLSCPGSLSAAATW
jgi:hypothetical protein